LPSDCCARLSNIVPSFMCRLQKSIDVCAPFVQPLNEQRRPPPWATQNGVLPTAPCLQLGCMQRGPPPCREHKSEVDAALFAQCGNVQRRPPPCFLHSPWPAALLLHPTCLHRLPPPCRLQSNESELAAHDWQPGNRQRWPPPCRLHNRVTESTTPFEHPSMQQRRFLNALSDELLSLAHSLFDIELERESTDVSRTGFRSYPSTRSECASRSAEEGTCS
jgi:hypothetical protein